MDDLSIGHDEGYEQAFAELRYQREHLSAEAFERWLDDVCAADAARERDRQADAAAYENLRRKLGRSENHHAAP